MKNKLNMHKIKIMKIAGFASIPVIVVGAVLAAGLVGGLVYEFKDNLNLTSLNKDNLLAQVVSDTCTDSDGGKNHETAGYVVSSDRPNGRTEDSCTNNTLFENYCGGNDNSLRQVETYTCPGVCANGACGAAPLMEKINLNPSESILTSGDNKTLYKFKVSAVNGDISLYKLTFKVSSSTAIGSNAKTSKFGLYAFIDSAMSNLDTTFTYGLVNNYCYKSYQGEVEIYFTKGGCDVDSYSLYTIPKGESRWFKLIASIGTLAPSGTYDAIQIQLEGDSTYPMLSSEMQTISRIESSFDNNFIWSPNINGNPTIGGIDWTNGHAVISTNMNMGVEIISKGIADSTPMPIVPINTITCTDSDGGKNYNQEGYAFISNLPYNRTMDSCVYDSDKNSYLYEAYCDGTEVKIEKIVCANGCGSGVFCASVKEPTLTAPVFVASTTPAILTITPTPIAPPTSIKVLSPNGGENWELGKTYQIKWSGEVQDAKIFITLENDNTLQFESDPVATIGTNVVNTGAFNWTIPNDISGGKYYIRINCSENCAFVPGDDSDALFTISAALQPSQIRSASSGSGVSAVQVQDKINALLEQIKKLQDQIKAQQSQPSTQTSQPAPITPVTPETQPGDLGFTGEETETFSYTWNRDLYYGLTNDNDVRALQNALTLEGVYKGPVTGNFFRLTRQAVIDFQKKHNFTNIPNTGYVGPYTRKKLNEIYSK